MPENSSDRLVLDVYRNAVDGRTAVALAQLDANDAGTGYRLAGPKHYNQGTSPVLSWELDARDAVEIRRMLDAVFGAAPVTRRQIGDPAELDALPLKSVVLDRNQDVWQSCGGGRWSVMFGASTGSAERVLLRGAVTLLWAPGGER